MYNLKLVIGGNAMATHSWDNYSLKHAHVHVHVNFWGNCNAVHKMSASIVID